jgi:hypothetical protein
MDKEKYSHRCRIAGLNANLITEEIWPTFECRELSQPFSVFAGSPSLQDTIRVVYNQFDWQVWFYTSGQPKRTETREKSVGFGKEGILPILVKASGQIVDILPDPGYPRGNLLVVDVGPQRPFYITCQNCDLSLGVGDWVELKEKYTGVTHTQTSIIDDAEILAKFPKEGKQS